MFNTHLKSSPTQIEFHGPRLRRRGRRKIEIDMSALDPSIAVGGQFRDRFPTIPQMQQANIETNVWSWLQNWSSIIPNSPSSTSEMVNFFKA